jgi:hypothetical protein
LIIYRVAAPFRVRLIQYSAFSPASYAIASENTAFFSATGRISQLDNKG